MPEAGPISAPITTAVLGFGLAGRVFHCPFVSAVPDLALKVILQRTGDSARQAYPQATIARSLHEVLADATIELVVVGTPNETHFDFARQALQAGKHVVVDKPFAASREEARELIELAKQVSKRIIPFHNRRFDGDFLTVRKLLSEQTLGRIVEVHSRFDRFRPELRESSWKEAPSPMSGVLFDLGPHLLDQAVVLFGIPEFITAQIHSDREGSSVDDDFDITLSYQSGGLRYNCGASLLAAEPAPRFRINGTAGSYTKFGVDPQEPVVISGRMPPITSSQTAWLTEPEPSWGHLTVPTAPDEKTMNRQPYPTIPGDYRQFYTQVARAIRSGEPAPVEPQAGELTIRLLELARESYATGKTLPVVDPL